MSLKNVVKVAAEKARQKQAQYVIKQLAAGKSRTEIAIALGVSRQRVHQIEKAAKA